MNANSSGTDLTYSYLRKAALSYSNLTYSNLRNANSSGDLTYSNLSGVKSGGIISNELTTIPNRYSIINGYIIGRYVDLSGADLSGATYDIRTSFTEGISPDSMGMVFTTLGVKSKFIPIDSEYALLYIGSSSEIFMDIINNEFQTNHKKQIPLNDDVNNDDASNFLSNQSEEFLTNIKNVIYRTSIPSLTEIGLHVYQENQITVYSSSRNAEIIEDLTFLGSTSGDYLLDVLSSNIDSNVITDGFEFNFFILFKNVNPNIVIKFIKRTTH